MFSQAVLDYKGLGEHFGGSGDEDDRLKVFGGFAHASMAGSPVIMRNAPEKKKKTAAGASAKNLWDIYTSSTLDPVWPIHLLLLPSPIRSPKTCQISTYRRLTQSY